MTDNRIPARRTGHKQFRRGCLLLACAFGGFSASAGAQDSFGVDTSLSAGIATNPFLASGPAPTAASATLDIHPIYVSEKALTKFRLEGDFNLTEYSRSYPTNDSYSVTGIGEQRISETSTITAELSYVNSINGSYNNVIVPVAEPELPSNLPTFVGDVALTGIGQRRQSYQALAGYSNRLSPVDTIDLQLSELAIRYGSGSGLDEFNYVSPSASYTRAISSGTSVSGNINVGIVDYLGQRLGDAVIVTPTAEISRTVASGYVLTASAGVSIASLKAPGGTRTSTNFSGSISACRREPRWNLCVNAARETLPSSIEGVRNATTVGALFGRQLTEGDDLSVSASYSRTSGPLLTPLPNAVQSDSTEFVTGTANYNHRIARNLSAFVAGGISKAYGQISSIRSNLELRVGARYRFGRAR